MSARRYYRTNRWALAALIESSDHRNRTAFGRVAGISRGSLADILSGRRDAGADALERMADALDVDVRAISADPDAMVPALRGACRGARATAERLAHRLRADEQRPAEDDELQHAETIVRQLWAVE